MFLQKNNTKFLKSYFMKLAFNLANIHNNMTGVNPSVGCLVCKKNKILSYGVEQASKWRATCLGTLYFPPCQKLKLW